MKWVIGIVAILVVMCGGLCAAGGLFYYTSSSTDDLALPDFQPIDPTTIEPVDAAVASGSGEVGVAECDEYIKTMTACLSSMDPAMKSAMEESFKQTTDAWRSAAATEAGKASLAVGCKAALDAIPSNCTIGGSGATAATTPGAEPAPSTDAPAAATTEPTTTTPASTTSSSTASTSTTKPATTATSSSSSTASTTKPATTSTTTTKPATTSTTTTKSSTTTTTPTTSTTTGTSTKQGTGLKPKSEDDDGGAPPPLADATVAVGFVLPSGGKWDDLVVGMDGKSLGKRPLRTRATPGVHTFTFKADGIDLSCSIEVGTSGRTIILDGKKKSCPSKSS